MQDILKSAASTKETIINNNKKTKKGHCVFTLQRIEKIKVAL